MSVGVLSVIANQRKLGEVVYRSNRLAFRYHTEWQAWENAFPLSVSMPLPQEEHGHTVVEAFLWGLLPDNPRVLETWGRRFHVSPRNVFRLLEHVGEDCAGAIQFVQPERESEVMGQNDVEQVEWITEDNLRERLEEVLRNHGAQRSSQDRGQFSLAGAQPKIALYRSPLENRWGVPYGVTPTTHIFKPASHDYNGIAENEHFCLTLASRVGLRTAQSWVIFGESLPTIVVKRYDRLQSNNRCLRIHQEDMCQATGVGPDRKYQSEGGPGVLQICELLRDVSSDVHEDILMFAKSLIFNFLISGTDAHAKNYSLLLLAQSQIRMAPLYDVVSSLPYPKDISPFKARMAMKIGDEYKIRNIQPQHWQACAKELRISWPIFRDLFQSTSEQVIQSCPSVAEELKNSGLHHPVISTLYQQILERVRRLSQGFL